MLGRHAEDVAAGGEQGPLAVRRQAKVGLLGDVDVAYGRADTDHARAGAGAVVRHADRKLVQGLRRQVEHIEVSALLEGDGPGRAGVAERGEVDVIVGEVGDLAELLAVEVIDPDVGATVAVPVGEEIDAPASPHRRGVGALPVGDPGQDVAVEVVGEHVLRQAAVIAFPGAEIAEDPGVGDAVAVRAVGHEAGAVERHLGGQAAGERHAEGQRDPAVPSLASGQEDDGLAVRRPGDHHVVRTPAGRRLLGDVGVEGQAPRRTALCGDDIDVPVALHAGGIGDPLAIRGVARHQVLARVGGQPAGDAASAVDHPEIAVRHEDDRVAMLVREAHQHLVAAGGRSIVGQGSRGTRKQECHCHGRAKSKGRAGPGRRSHHALQSGGFRSGVL